MLAQVSDNSVVFQGDPRGICHKHLENYAIDTIAGVKSWHQNSLTQRLEKKVGDKKFLWEKVLKMRNILQKNFVRLFLDIG